VYLPLLAPISGCLLQGEEAFNVEREVVVFEYVDLLQKLLDEVHPRSAATSNVEVKSPEAEGETLPDLYNGDRFASLHNELKKRRDVYGFVVPDLNPPIG